MTCPKCGSTNVKVELRSAGTRARTNYYRTGVKKSWLLPSGVRSYKSERKHTSIALCQNCGHHWAAAGENKGCAFYLLCLMFWPIALGMWYYGTPLFKLDKRLRLLIIVLFWAAFFVIALNSPSTANGA